jgi:hypothetical protein
MFTGKTFPVGNVVYDWWGLRLWVCAPCNSPVRPPHGRSA